MTFKRRFIFPLLTGSHFSLAHIARMHNSSDFPYYCLKSSNQAPCVLSSIRWPTQWRWCLLRCCCVFSSEQQQEISFTDVVVAGPRVKSQFDEQVCETWNKSQLSMQKKWHTVEQQTSSDLTMWISDACLVISSLLCSSEWSGHEKSTSISLFGGFGQVGVGWRLLYGNEQQSVIKIVKSINIADTGRDGWMSQLEISTHFHGVKVNFFLFALRGSSISQR